MVGSIVIARMRQAKIGLSLLLTGLVIGLLATSPAAAGVRPLEVSEYRDIFDVSKAKAEEVLETQAKAGEAGVVENLEARLDEDFGGIWFNPEAGEYVIAMTSAAAPAIDREMATAELAEDYRTRIVQYSWEELEAAQHELDKKLTEFFEVGLVYTSLDPRINATVLHVAADASERHRAILRQIAGEVGDEVELRAGTDDRFGISSNACSPVTWAANCGTPFRGGVGISYVQHDENASCTAAFRAIGGNGKRYVITAGHCALKDIEHPDLNDLWTQWKAWDEQLISSTPSKYGEAKYLGQVEQISPFPTYDWMKIDATGTAWDTWNTPQGWPSTVAYWQAGQGKPAIDEEYDINWEAKSVDGQTVCHSGVSSGTTCGLVVATNASLPREGGVGYGLVKVKGSCQAPGDSGGPWFFANTAYGIHNGSDLQNGGPCDGHGFYQEITQATEALGVSVAQATKVTATATALNGNPGWVTVKGTVTMPGSGTVISNKEVKIKLFKWESGSWALKATLPTTVNNNYYEVKDWNGVGPGSWTAQAVFPAQDGLAESKSSDVTEGSFTVKDGYRFVAKHSGSCLDVYGASKENGGSIVQWACDNPATVQNQVFTLVPQEGYFRLVPRHSNGCADIAYASTADGANLFQWACNYGAGNANQLFQLVDAGGGNVELRPKHSNKCLTVSGGSNANGTPVQQWSCVGANHQKWTIQSVDSGPIPIDAFITLGETWHGQHGYASVSGYFKAGYYPLAGKVVNVNYQKEVGPGQWETKSTGPATLNNEGFYSFPNMGVAPGRWRVRAVLPAASPFAEAASPYKEFEIKRGYRFYFRHSDQCMSLHANLPADGTPILQWPCGPLDPSLGQTFTLMPVGGGWFQVKINSTGKCLDVHGASQAQMAAIEQWGCVGPNHLNQIWQVMPIAGQYPWNALIAKHSGQCASSTGPQNGAAFVQWACIWAGTQQWKFQAVD